MVGVVVFPIEIVLFWGTYVSFQAGFLWRRGGPYNEAILFGAFDMDFPVSYVRVLDISKKRPEFFELN